MSYLVDMLYKQILILLQSITINQVVINIKSWFVCSSKKKGNTDLLFCWLHTQSLSCSAILIIEKTCSSP
jgi:hypothetical protein